MQVDENLSVSKYLEAIATMSTAIGQLDVLKMHLKSVYNDNMSVAILEEIIKNLAKASGVDYKSLNIELAKTITRPIESNYITTGNKPQVMEIVEAPKAESNYITDIAPAKTKQNESNVFAKYMNFAEKTAKKVIGKKTETKQNNKENIEENEISYEFSNSSNLACMVYNKKKYELIMMFVKNGRIYKYYNIPEFIVNNLIQYDQENKSAGGYFNQNVIKKSDLYYYEEITNNNFIG